MDHENVAPARNVRAQTWYRLVDETSLHIEDDTQEFLKQERGVVNFCVICGSLGVGKSYLLNAIARIKGFVSGDSTTGVTKGVEVVPCAFDDISNHDGDTVCERPKTIFADLEGQGEQGEAYDAKLLTPCFLIAKAIIYVTSPAINRIGRDEVLIFLDRMMLATKVIVKEQRHGRLFANLHIVIRDCRKPEGQMRDLIFGMESEEGSQAARDRNRRRREVEELFESVHVWCLPLVSSDYFEDGASFPENYEDVRPPIFAKKVNDLRAMIAEQSRTPRLVAGLPLTGHRVADLILRVSAELRSDTPALNPVSIRAQVAIDEARQVMKSLLSRAKQQFDDMGCGSHPDGQPEENLRAYIDSQVNKCFHQFGELLEMLFQEISPARALLEVDLRSGLEALSNELIAANARKLMAAAEARSMSRDLLNKARIDFDEMARDIPPQGHPQTGLQELTDLRSAALLRDFQERAGRHLQEGSWTRKTLEEELRRESMALSHGLIAENASRIREVEEAQRLMRKLLGRATREFGDKARALPPEGRPQSELQASIQSHIADLLRDFDEQVGSLFPHKAKMRKDFETEFRNLISTLVEDLNAENEKLLAQVEQARAAMLGVLERAHRDFEEIALALPPNGQPEDSLQADINAHTCRFVNEFRVQVEGLSQQGRNQLEAELTRGIQSSADELILTNTQRLSMAIATKARVSKEKVNGEHWLPYNIFCDRDFRSCYWRANRRPGDPEGCWPNDVARFDPCSDEKVVDASAELHSSDDDSTQARASRK